MRCSVLCIKSAEKFSLHMILRHMGEVVKINEKDQKGQKGASVIIRSDNLHGVAV